MPRVACFTYGAGLKRRGVPGWSDEFQVLLQGTSQALQRRLGRVASTALDAADVGLADSGSFGQFALRHPAGHTGVPELQAKLDGGLKPPAQRSLAERLGHLAFGHPVIEPG